MKYSRHRAFKRPLIAVLAMLIFNCPAWTQSQVVADQDEANELIVKVKAAFLLNFIKYTKWSGEAFEDEESQLVVLMLGEDTMGKALDKTMSKGKQHGREIRVMRLGMPERDDYRTESGYREALGRVAQSVTTSHLVYYTGDRSSDREWLAETIGGGNTLTVGETRGATDDGLMFGFVIDRRKLRFRAGFEAIEQSQIEVNPRLLGLAINKP